MALQKIPWIVRSKWKWMTIEHVAKDFQVTSSSVSIDKQRPALQYLIKADGSVSKKEVKLTTRDQAIKIAEDAIKDKIPAGPSIDIYSSKFSYVVSFKTQPSGKETARVIINAVSGKIRWKRLYGKD